MLSPSHESILRFYFQLTALTTTEMEADMELIVKMKAEKAGIEDNVYRLEQINSYNTDLDAQIKEAEKSLARAKTDLDKETKGVVALLAIFFFHFFVSFNL